MSPSFGVSLAMIGCSPLQVCTPASRVHISIEAGAAQHEGVEANWKALLDPLALQSSRWVVKSQPLFSDKTAPHAVHDLLQQWLFFEFAPATQSTSRRKNNLSSVATQRLRAPRIIERVCTTKSLRRTPKEVRSERGALEKFLRV